MKARECENNLFPNFADNNGFLSYISKMFAAVPRSLKINREVYEASLYNCLLLLLSGKRIILACSITSKPELVT